MQYLFAQILGHLTTTSALSFEPVQDDDLAAFGTSQPDEGGELDQQGAADGGQGRMGRRTGGAGFPPAGHSAEAAGAAGRRGRPAPSGRGGAARPRSAPPSGRGRVLPSSAGAPARRPSGP